MRHKKMTVSLREERGTRSCRSLRRGGQLPGVLYGGLDGDGKPDRRVASIVVDRKEFEALIHDGVKFVDVELDSQETPTVVKDLQWDAFDDHILHVDFERIDVSKPLVVNVPLIFKGIAKGQKVGAIVSTFVSDLAVRGLPREIPESIVVRIDEVGAGASLKVADVEVSENLELVTSQDRVIMECKIKRVAIVEEEEADAEEEGAGETAESAGK
jgi:large subunit ribosomal protein L25